MNRVSGKVSYVENDFSSYDNTPVYFCSGLPTNSDIFAIPINYDERNYKHPKHSLCKKGRHI